MSERRRVVITGLGVIASNGVGKDAFWQAISNGRSGVSHISSFDTSNFPVHFAGEIKDFDPSQFIDKKNTKRMDRTSQLAVACAKMAVKDAGFDLSSNGKDRAGVIIGTAMAGHGYILNQHVTLRDKGPMRISPYTALASFPDACASQVSIELGVTGPSFSISTACSSASDAASYACEAIRSNVVDFMVMGGAEASIYPGILAAFCVARALSQRNDAPAKASRPFSLDRDGFVLGEGAGIFILEEYEHARQRGARIYAEVLGCGMTCDAYHMTSPEPSGKEAVRAMKMALAEAKVNSSEIDYINAHGTSTVLNDKTETSIIKQVFGERAHQIPVSATKSMIGHLIGAAGSVELVATLLAMENDLLPPTINYETPDPECDLDYVPNEARSVKIKTAMKNSFGFGGKNSILIVRKV
ncbi:MAG: beta-ketoacyl-[acyl-carrier-protein] synthase II [Candidatus Omnitrophica bacterium CG11_big_fil_rev_8_21_14_0_20_45_26]|uniref:3-oxoacyl-[acyl-carrier-protein] synthase 2 n=1 Tax=Candidatus Abzuiibacterium crystallinum TaxID=1974748 RepID=A0A2H0LSJ6_9BACT|nr:MAG: beta-ketoacyl-[acyl-carrier-protein] synthase II [Candidatus Omnitrophica bacterium CG11_big_fil_rev_8_21_14_0_20_45_26]PIW64048.1 MAG: beta-ketoacyl-[acyl-carrier-protein] synthase II [Candidatus Omnitrophica bacterium CG12_big_fil_rev_8_21_14_0_65_45_16]